MYYRDAVEAGTNRRGVFNGCWDIIVLEQNKTYQTHSSRKWKYISWLLAVFTFIDRLTVRILKDNSTC